MKGIKSFLFSSFSHFRKIRGDAYWTKWKEIELGENTT